MTHPISSEHISAKYKGLLKLKLRLGDESNKYPNGQDGTPVSQQNVWRHNILPKLKGR